MIQNKSTYYFCQFFELPVFEQDVHMIKYEMIVDKRNKDMVHHLLVHECDKSNLQGEIHGDECGSVNPPPDTSKCLQSSLIAAWVIKQGFKNLEKI